MLSGGTLSSLYSLYSKVPQERPEPSKVPQERPDGFFDLEPT
jgi:hypothetical protein